MVAAHPPCLTLLKLIGIDLRIDEKYEKCTSLFKSINID